MSDLQRAITFQKMARIFYAQSDFVAASHAYATARRLMGVE